MADLTSKDWVRGVRPDGKIYPVDPVIVSGLQVDSVVDNLVTLSWTASTSPDFASYKLYATRVADSSVETLTTTNISETYSASFYDEDYEFVVTELDLDSNESAPQAVAVTAHTDPVSQPTGAIYVGPVATGDGDGRSDAHRMLLQDLPLLNPGATVQMAAGDYNGYNAVVDDSFGFDGGVNYSTRRVGLHLLNTSGTETDPITFTGVAGTVIKGPDFSDSLRFGLYVENCDWIVFDNVNLDGSRPSGRNMSPRLRIDKMAVLLDSTNITYKNSSSVRSNAGRFEIERSEYCHIHDNIIQYGGHPDQFQDGTVYGADDLTEAKAINPDNGDLFVVGHESKYCLIENNNISYGGHVPASIGGEYNVFRNNTIDNVWPEAEFGVHNITTDHPYHSQTTSQWPQLAREAVMQGKPFGNRAMTLEGSFANGGFGPARNVFENNTIVNTGASIDGAQVTRVSGAQNIFRFNTIQRGGARNGGANMGGTRLESEPWKSGFECEMYNNEYIDVDEFRGYSDHPYCRISGSAGGGAAWNRVYNNAYGQLNASAYQFILELENVSANWPTINANYPRTVTNGGPLADLTDEWSGNEFKNNTFTQSDTALSMEVPSGNGTTAAVQARGAPTSTYVSGNVGGAFKSATAGMAHAQTTNSGLNSFGPIQLDTTNPFIAPNLYPQISEGDEVVIDGVTTRITDIDETNKTIMVDTAVTWTSGIGVSLAEVTVGNNITTGLVDVAWAIIPSHEFTRGTSSTWDISSYLVDPNGVVTSTEVTAGITLPEGVTYNGITKVFSYDGSAGAVTVTGITVDAITSTGTAVVPVWDNVVARQEHSLTSGVDVGTIDLKANMSTPGSVFSLIGSNRLLAEGDLPSGLTLNPNGTITGTPTQTGVWVIRVRSANGTFSSEADWAARTASADAAHKIDSAQDVADATQSPIGGNKNGDQGWDFWNTFDTSTKLYGNGSMRYRYPSGTVVTASGEDVRSGFHTKNVAWNTANSGWSVGDSFYTCWSFRCDRNSVKYLGDQFGPNPKIALFDMRVGFVNPNTNDWETVIHFEDGGNIGGYLNRQGSTYGDQWERSQSTAYSSSDIANTPGVDRGVNQLNGVDPGLASGNGAGQPWTAWQQDRYRYGSLYSYRTLEGGPDNHSDPIHGGLKMPYDDWVHFKVRHTIGTPGTNTSRQTTWYAHHGQDWLLLNDVTYSMGFDGSAPNYFQGGFGSPAQDTTFEVLWFNLLAFGAAGDSGRPEKSRWHDGIITSASDIAAPGFSAGAGDYRSADAFVTLRVS